LAGGCADSTVAYDFLGVREVGTEKKERRTLGDESEVLVIKWATGGPELKSAMEDQAVN
jgi:hypothetical protein